MFKVSWLLKQKTIFVTPDFAYNMYSKYLSNQVIDIYFILVLTVQGILTNKWKYMETHEKKINEKNPEKKV